MTLPIPVPHAFKSLKEAQRYQRDVLRELGWSSTSAELREEDGGVTVFVMLHAPTPKRRKKKTKKK